MEANFLWNRPQIEAKFPEYLQKLWILPHSSAIFNAQLLSKYRIREESPPQNPPLDAPASCYSHPYIHQNSPHSTTCAYHSMKEKKDISKWPGTPRRAWTMILTSFNVLKWDPYRRHKSFKLIWKPWFLKHLSWIVRDFQWTQFENGVLTIIDVILKGPRFFRTGRMITIWEEFHFFREWLYSLRRFQRIPDKSADRAFNPSIPPYIPW